MISRTQTQFLADIPENDDLPRQVHKLADRWRQLNERADDLIVESERLEVIGISGAQRQDREALAHALDTEADVIPEGDEHERAARRALQIIEHRWPQAERELADAGNELVQALLKHRRDLAKIHKPRIEAALTDYHTVVTRARTAIASITTRLAQTCEIGDLLVALDQGESNAAHGAPTLPVTLDTTAATNTATDIIELLTTPLDDGHVTIIGANGLTLNIRRETAGTVSLTVFPAVFI